MRLKARFAVIMSSTSAGEKDLGNLDPSAYECCDAMNEGGVRKHRVLKDIEGQSIWDAMLATAGMVIVKTDQKVRLHWTAGVDPDETEGTIDVAVPDGFDFGYFVVTCLDLTELDVSNYGDSTANVVVGLGGDVD